MQFHFLFAEENYFVAGMKVLVYVNAEKVCASLLDFVTKGLLVIELKVMMTLLEKQS